MKAAVIGYGEVGGIFARDLRSHGVAAPGIAAALDGAAVAFVCVTARSALDAMRSLRGALAHAPFVMDVNSVAPATKQAAARLIEQAKGEVGLDQYEVRPWVG